MDLRAARDELLGKAAIAKPKGGYFQHLKEVTEALRGLRERVEALQRRLGYVHLGETERQAVARELSEGSQLLDFAEGFLKR